MAQDAPDIPQCTSSPFEGPEKLLEIWFAPSVADLPDAGLVEDGRSGLRKIKREIWEEMLEIVKCKVLSYIEGKEIDAYLLSESSFFVFPHRLILKTCGTTLNLLGLPRILEIAQTHASLPSVYRLFYSRKSFMFPERQQGPHRDWRDEVSYLDGIFNNGSAYTVGKVNGDHWLLYITGPGEGGPADTAPNSPSSNFYTKVEEEEILHDDVATLAAPEELHLQDYTIEILMSKLSSKASQPFFSKVDCSENCSEEGLALSSAIGITELFPAHITTLDAYSFTPCGYSSNALLKWGDAAKDPSFNYGTPHGSQAGGEGYYTIHVTPEDGWSYASFECNLPLRTHPLGKDDDIPDLKSLIRRVVKIFEPGRLTLTLFISSEDNNNAEEQGGETAIEAAQRAFKAALTVPPFPSSKRSSKDGRFTEDVRGMYRRTDKINYEFGGYDLAFASFELR